MAELKVTTSFNIDLDFEIPEFYRRLFAWLIDVVIQYIYLRVIIEIYKNSITASDYFSEDGMYNGWGLSWMLIVPVLVYHPVCEILMNGQSIGKKIIGLRVVNENSGRASVSQFIIRWLVRTGDWAIVILLLFWVYVFLSPEFRMAFTAAILLLIADIILVAASKKGQRLGDILAHTIIVKTTTRGSMEETVFMEVAGNYVPVFPQIMRLSDKDINAIKTILDTSRRRGDFNMAAMAAEKIKAHLNIQSSLSPFDFLDTLLKDYNCLSTK
ncbi:MAG: hypothetical protein C4308_07725 [Chitinophagaceae bacterium]